MDLTSSISQIPKITKATLKKLENLGLKNCLDLLYHYPFRYEDWSKIISVKELKEKMTGTVKVKVKNINSRRTPRKRMIITEAVVSDKTDSIKVVWFGQFFLNKILKLGQEIYLAGKIENVPIFGLQMVSPSYEFPQKQKAPIHLGRLVPIYPTTERLSQKQLRLLIKEILPLTRQVDDWLPNEIKSGFNLPNLSYALEQIHFPASQNLLERAIHRLKFDELFLIQLQTQILRERIKQKKAPKLTINLEKIKKFVNQLPFKLTDSQKKSAWEIIKDLEKEKPMNRLLEGDVGSGKTVVATMAILNTILNNYQVAYLAPTEILAQQHFENISQLLKKWPVQIGLLTRETQLLRIDGKNKKIPKKEMIEKIIRGEFNLIIGTHAIISARGGSASGGQEGIKFKNLGLIIVDEQHRFGVEQRAQLTRSQTTNSSESTNLKDLQMDVSKSIEKNKIIEKDLSYRLVGIFFKIQAELGRFCREKQYTDALEKELILARINFKRESPIKIANIKSNFADFIVERKILVEAKAKTFIEKNDYYQVKRYLENSGLELGLLVNFHDKYLKPKRVLNSGIRRSHQIDTSENSDHSDKFVNSDRYIAHFLSMTATPIPRSLALTLYGDLDLSIINQMPPGRKEVVIKIISTKEKNKVYDFIRKEIEKGRQAFVVCPLIDPSDKMGFISVKQEFEKLSQNIFPDLNLAILHGKLSNLEKEKIMAGFMANKIQMLISTTVVEVGIDVPNATIMLIEGAERFGLAQLWQLKGRVGRSEYQSHCFLFPENPSEKARNRLKAILNAKNGFELAEKDLEIRGPGEIFGFKQSGYLESLKLACLSDTQIIKETQEAAQKIFSTDPLLKKFPQLQEKVEELTKTIHLE